eukprot:GEMP01024458.1.p1 GENE.GEMP01024458.1~~GEMP01024458.1.p1  ORF type:complete len:355 (+),score=82.03 GEMP01024458.1:374-1438(+)
MSADSRIHAIFFAVLCGVFAAFKAFCAGIAIPLCGTLVTAIVSGIFVQNNIVSPDIKMRLVDPIETPPPPTADESVEPNEGDCDSNDALCDHFTTRANDTCDTNDHRVCGAESDDTAAAYFTTHPKAPALVDSESSDGRSSDEHGQDAAHSFDEENETKDKNDAVAQDDVTSAAIRDVDIEKALKHKDEGNQAFKNGDYEEAMDQYTDAMVWCPDEEKHHFATLYSNRAACFQHMEDWEAVARDASKAIELKEDFLKAYHRRCKAHEQMNKWQDALTDLNKIIELDPSQKEKMSAHHKVVSQKAAAQFEKEKDEMLGKLKEMGNSVLGYFGMSTDNFQMVKDPNTGSYSMSYKS